MVVFEDSTGVVRVFLCAENESIMELPSAELTDGVKHLMDAYYVFGVGYPCTCRPSPGFTRVCNGHKRVCPKAYQVYNIC